MIDKNNNDEEFDFSSLMEDNSVFITKQVVPSNYFEIYLDKPISEPNNYRKAFEVFKKAQEGDLIKIHIDTPGGNVDTAIKFINAIQETEASVLGSLEQKAYSAGSLILLSCPMVQVKPWASFMAHSASSGFWGTFSGMKEQLVFFEKEVNRLMEKTYEGFLTPNEIDDVVKGRREIWLPDKEIVKRLNSRAEFLQAKAQAPVKKTRQKRKPKLESVIQEAELPKGDL